jgi:hypothetical protein
MSTALWARLSRRLRPTWSPHAMLDDAWVGRSLRLSRVGEGDCTHRRRAPEPLAADHGHPHPP